MTKWKYLLLQPHDRFKLFLRQNPHRTFSAQELAREFRVSREEFTRKYPLPEIECAWESPDPKGEALPEAAPYGQNLETDPIRFHQLPSGLRLKITRAKEAFTEISKETFTLAPPGRNQLFYFRVPTARMPLYAGHPNLCLVCMGCYFYLEPDFNNLGSILDSVDQHLLEWEQEELAQQKMAQERRAAGRQALDNKGLYHY